MAAARKPTFRSNSAPLPFSSSLLQFVASAIGSCVRGLPGGTSKSSDAEKGKCLTRVEWLPVTSRSHRLTNVRLV